jgi:hypothetical protein
MTDILLVTSTVALFAIALTYVRACDRLNGRKPQ